MTAAALWLFGVVVFVWALRTVIRALTSPTRVEDDGCGPWQP